MKRKPGRPKLRKEPSTPFTFDLDNDLNEKMTALKAKIGKDKRQFIHDALVAYLDSPELRKELQAHIQEVKRLLNGH